MGFRNYAPGLNQFLTRDSYNGALADQNLQTNPWTGNRYAFTGGNPTTNVEIDGHIPAEPPSGGGTVESKPQGCWGPGSEWLCDGPTGGGGGSSSPNPNPVNPNDVMVTIKNPNYDPQRCNAYFRMATDRPVSAQRAGRPGYLSCSGPRSTEIPTTAVQCRGCAP